MPSKIPRACCRGNGYSTSCLCNNKVVWQTEQTPRLPNRGPSPLVFPVTNVKYRQNVANPREGDRNESYFPDLTLSPRVRRKIQKGNNQLNYFTSQGSRALFKDKAM